MKRRFFTCGLAAALALGMLPLTGYAAGAEVQSGDPQLPRLTPEQIHRVLDDGSAEMPAIKEGRYDELPSCTAPYAPGKVKDQWLQASTNRVNLIRRMAGLPPVVHSPALSHEAQYGTVVCEVVGMDHHPGQPEDMPDDFYEIAYGATSSSNLGWGYGSITQMVDGCMDDSDSSNISRLGHRRWLLNPPMGKIGFGMAGTMTATKVFDKSGPGCAYDMVSWPSSGYFPTSMMHRSTAWSISVNPEVYQSPEPDQIQVRLSRDSDGKTWNFPKESEGPYGDTFYAINLVGYGVGNAIIFRPDLSAPESSDWWRYQEDTYHVEVTGLHYQDGSPAEPLRYSVSFFDPDKLYPEEYFDDVQSEYDWWTKREPDYFCTPVRWALAHQITNGTGYTTFSPELTCTRGQIITFLWRAAGCPEPGIANPFTDVPDTYYTKAAIWAAEQGMASGDTFAPEAPCTRAMAVEFLWRAAGSPEAAAETFADVPDDAGYAPAVGWALERGVTNGTGDDTFSPEQTCTRGQIVTFLYRDRTSID